MRILIVLLYFVQAHQITLTTSDEHADNTSKNVTYPDNWLEVPLDHFNLFDNRTWKMRYLINEEYYEEGGPMFIEIGGEWTVDSKSLTIKQIKNLVEKHKGVYIATEHRYYGKSLPFLFDLSLDGLLIEKLKYLQIEQALEDLAYFIDHFKSSFSQYKNSKVVVHGCSYGGMLASWMRLRFPHFVDIAYASSAPIGVGLTYPEYYEIVHDVYANVSISCIDTIKKGFDIAQKLLQTKDGRKTVRDALRNWNCSNVEYMNSETIVAQMIKVLNVQNDPHHFEEVSCLVLTMDMDSMDAFERLANLVVLKSKNKYACSYFQDTEEGIRELIAWYYQICTELGSFQIISKKNPRNPFGIDRTIEESVEGCVIVLGEQMSENVFRTGVERLNRRYGGKNIKTTKLLSVQGTLDPLNKQGLLKESTPENPVILIEGAHCIDVVENDDDPEELWAEREKIRNIVSNWINEA